MSAPALARNPDLCTSCGSDDSVVLGTNQEGWITECRQCHYRWVIPTEELK